MDLIVSQVHVTKYLSMWDLRFFLILWVASVWWGLAQNDGRFLSGSKASLFFLISYRSFLRISTIKKTVELSYFTDLNFCWYLVCFKVLLEHVA